MDRGATVVKVVETGSQSSGWRELPLSEKGMPNDWPPMMRTVPVGRTMPLAKIRGKDMELIFSTVGAVIGIPIVMM